jgi:hypothetical protein
MPMYERVLDQTRTARGSADLGRESGSNNAFSTKLQLDLIKAGSEGPKRGAATSTSDGSSDLAAGRRACALMWSLAEDIQRIARQARNDARELPTAQ